mgnify:CR=1 FL=1
MRAACCAADHWSLGIIAVRSAIVIERLPLDGTRPLAAERDSMAILYAARRSAYKHAHLHLKADRATTDELASQIVIYLGED